MCSHSKEQLIRNIDRNKRSKNNNKKKKLFHLFLLKCKWVKWGMRLKVWRRAMNSREKWCRCNWIKLKLCYNPFYSGVLFISCCDDPIYNCNTEIFRVVKTPLECMPQQNSLAYNWVSECPHNSLITWATTQNNILTEAGNRAHSHCLLWLNNHDNRSIISGHKTSELNISNNKIYSSRCVLCVGRIGGGGGDFLFLLRPKEE